jgi:hypothetical protein
MNDIEDDRYEMSAWLEKKNEMKVSQGGENFEEKNVNLSLTSGSFI